MVTDIGASEGSCFACSACSCNSVNSSDILSLSHDFHDHALVPLAVELCIENPLPRSHIQLARRNRHDHFMMDEERLQMGVAIVLAGLVMLVSFSKRSQMLEPLISIFDQSTFIVVDVDARGDMHG